MHFCWDKDGNWQYSKIPETPVNVIAPDHIKRPYIIKQVETNIGIKGLGIHLDPADSYKTQISVMTKKSNEWSHVMKNSVISRLSAILALQTTITKSHQDKLPVLTLSKSECEKL